MLRKSQSPRGAENAPPDAGDVTLSEARAAPSDRGSRCATSTAPVTDWRRYAWREPLRAHDGSGIPAAAPAILCRLVATLPCRSTASTLPRLHEGGEGSGWMDRESKNRRRFAC